MKTQLKNSRPRRAFSLVEVVLALGVIAIAITAILGVLPVALSTGHSAQDETRAAHIAQSAFGSLVAEARTASGNLNPAATIPSTTTSVDLTSSSQYTMYADNNGQLTNSAANATYAITIYTNITDPASANAVTVRVLWPLVPNQGPTPAPNQTFRDYVRIISRY